MEESISQTFFNKSNTVLLPHGGFEKLQSTSRKYLQIIIKLSTKRNSCPQKLKVVANPISSFRKTGSRGHEAKGGQQSHEKQLKKKRRPARDKAYGCQTNLQHSAADANFGDSVRESGLFPATSAPASDGCCRGQTS